MSAFRAQNSYASSQEHKDELALGVGGAVVLGLGLAVDIPEVQKGGGVGTHSGLVTGDDLRPEGFVIPGFARTAGVLSCMFFEWRQRSRTWATLSSRA